MRFHTPMSHSCFPMVQFLVNYSSDQVRDSKRPRRVFRYIFHYKRLKNSPLKTDTFETSFLRLLTRWRSQYFLQSGTQTDISQSYWSLANTMIYLYMCEEGVQLILPLGQGHAIISIARLSAIPPNYNPIGLMPEGQPTPFVNSLIWRVFWTSLRESLLAGRKQKGRKYSELAWCLTAWLNSSDKHTEKECSDPNYNRRSFPINAHNNLKEIAASNIWRKYSWIAKMYWKGNSLVNVPGDHTEC